MGPAGYYRSRKLGEGTYAVIYQAKRVEDAPDRILESEPAAHSGLVAIKRIKRTAYAVGQEISAIREIKALKAIRNPYVVEILDIFVVDGLIHLALEYVEYDLEQILKNKSLVILPGDIKAWMHMLLRGVRECHRRFIIHRDIKPNNLLITAAGVLKLADFGLARTVSSRMTAQAITRWYRAPEVLLGAPCYSLPADMWAVGAVFAEMFLRVPFFAAESDLQQLDLIFQALGTPSDWPLAAELPGYFQFGSAAAPPLESLFTAASSEALALMRGLLQFDPLKRLTVLECLRHGYFTEEPPATPVGSLPVPGP